MQRLNWWKQAKVTSRVNCWWNLRTRHKIFCFLYYWGIHSVQVALARASGKGPWSANPLCNKGPGDLWCQPGDQIRASETRQELTMPSLDMLRLSGDKSPGFPLFVVPPWRHQLKLVFRYLVIAQRVNFILRIGTSETLLQETWGWAGKEVRKPGLTVLSVGCVVVKGLRSQLRWCDCQGTAWIVKQDSFLNINLPWGDLLTKTLWWWWWD